MWEFVDEVMGNKKTKIMAAFQEQAEQNKEFDEKLAEFRASPENTNQMNNKMTIDDFELMACVGRGSFGKVLQVRKKDNGKIYALKILNKSALVRRKQVAHTITERRILQNVGHPFIVSLRYAFQTKDKLYMVLDYFTGGELFHHLKNDGKFNEDRVRLYSAEIILALEALHKKNIIYRDLKPENILLDDQGHIILTDFGLSKEALGTDGLTHTFCGTPEYLAPEVLHATGHGKSVDWWSLGTLMYEMLTGLPPFYNQNLNVMYEKILRAKLTFPPYLSPEAKSLLSGLIERNVKKRLGSGDKDSEDLKSHPFFASIDWKKLFNKQYEPQFKPKTSGTAIDIQNVDEDFKQETPRDTPLTATPLGNTLNFPDFTYIPRESRTSNTYIPRSSRTSSTKK